MTDRPLTERQQDFIRHYIGEAKGNATLAAKLAGYTGTDAGIGVTACRLLKDARVHAALAIYREELAKLEAEQTEHAIMTAHEMQVRLSRMASGDVTLTEERLVSGGKDGFVVEKMPPTFQVQLGAMDALRKMRGYDAASKIEHSGLVGVDVALSPETEAALARWMRYSTDPVIAARLAELEAET